MKTGIKWILLALCISIVAQLKAQRKFRSGIPPRKFYGTVQLVFKNYVNQRPLVLNDSTYSNPWGETYRISKFKYYVSAISFHAAGKKAYTAQGYWLINQQDDSSRIINLKIPVNNYDSISFLQGVDSVHNCSGAQSGALDPVNDMFWTWNSGYVMHKIEGYSPQSTSINKKIEYHIGGYKGENSVLSNIVPALSPGKAIPVQRNKFCRIVINADINRLWNGNYHLSIAETPACTLPGEMAKKIAGNFSQVFSIESVSNEQP